MTHSTPHPAGLLTDDEAEHLSDAAQSPGSQTELRSRVKDRLQATIHDFSVLYPTLPAADIDAVFNPADEHAVAATRAATQDALALLTLGMLHNDDMLELRLRDAIRNAGLAYEEEIDVTLELRRAPLPTIEEFAAQHSPGEISERTLSLFEYFLWHPETDIDTLSTLSAKFDMELTAEEQQEFQTARKAFERPPQTTVTNVSVHDRPPEE
jgi:hypothetical protein